VKGFAYSNINWRPWDYTIGPTSAKGKLIASGNSYRHGYFWEIFREFRKNKRRSETIQFEWTCLSLIRAVDANSFDKVKRIIDDLNGFFLRTWEMMRNKQLNSSLTLELKYITALFERVIRYSLSLILKNLNALTKDQNGN